MTLRERLREADARFGDRASAAAEANARLWWVPLLPGTLAAGFILGSLTQYLTDAPIPLVGGAVPIVLWSIAMAVLYRRKLGD